MNIWKSDSWEEYYKYRTYRSGLRIRYDENVDSEVKRAIKECACWLRSKHRFPKRVCIYVKSERRIIATNGEKVCGTFWRPADRDKEPYIRLATGDYSELLKQIGKDNALASILISMLHELTHYFQWLNDVELTLIGEERQATNYSRKLIAEYAETREHP